ncbi:hypothetical protein L7F22_062992 [Adiantum nelumboides]|nr:hypothetical protein [Adiantum nelumboides]
MRLVHGLNQTTLPETHIVQRLCEKRIHAHPQELCRVEFLAALETVSQGSFRMLDQMERDFNEGDYEMLLALDDNNHSHSGASYNKIEQLPISVIKPTDIYQEICSICLETPVVDDVVCRLPCMHGFHLKCIDEWLGRQANCPICKMEI